ncbi:hypothetical protein KOI35_02585 [Actinoplanes bogorensis]|uniref:WXG100 family type VII secretion target n=1 Tax=Paractinoplanes bogorensis TaxID=1610840 RepID=A0ABS5YI41_9ACTN|nr:hypothetical protein [Actinoplanes bogorensis]MBU2662389.1 hypothetical protein [Actinoplanes bogorensis]
MTTYETLDLQSRVARYEAALEELRTAHHDVRAVLQDQVLYERWQQIGTELGFVGHGGGGATNGQQDLQALNQQIPQMSESWAS